MGLKTTNYNVPYLGIVIQDAYCKISKIDIGKDGQVAVFAEIQQTRENVDSLRPLHIINFNFITDKTTNIYEEAYTILKGTKLQGWEDDIVQIP